MRIRSQVGKNIVTVSNEDVSLSTEDAIVVPEYTNDVSDFGGVGLALVRKGFKPGMDAYAAHIKEHGPQKLGSIFPSLSGKQRPSHLLHAVTLDCKREEAFSIVHTAFLNALDMAERFVLGGIASPALSTGTPMGKLSPEQCAAAMLSAVHVNGQKQGNTVQTHIATYGDNELLVAFRNALENETYVSADLTQVGNKSHDPRRAAFALGQAMTNASPAYKK